MTTDITELAHGNSLRKKLNRRLNDAYGFQRTSGGKHTTISLSIDECKSIIAAMDKRIALVEALEKAQQRIVELESRTVTVRLPDPPGPMSVGARTVYFGIVADVVSAFQYGLNVAGIKVEVK